MAEFGETSAGYQANIAGPDHRNAHGLIPYNQTGTTGRPDLQRLGNIQQDGRQVFVNVGPRLGQSDNGMQQTDLVGAIVAIPVQSPTVDSTLSDHHGQGHESP